MINAKSSSAVECGSVPTDNCDVTQSTTFAQGNYSLPNGINITVFGVTLDCNGSTLIGSGGGNGINIRGQDNVIVKNCIIQNYTNGIYLVWSGSCSSYLYTSDSNTFQNNTIEYNSVGLKSAGHLPYCYGEGSLNMYNKITGNTIRSNSQGINLEYSHANIVFNNKFINNTQQAYDSVWDNTINYWNDSGQGNYWSNYDSEAEGCYDNNSDLSCDSPYNISGSAGSKDYLPLMGIQIVNILPIQVVEDVDLIMGKTTLVRATLKNSGQVGKNITVKLYFEDNLKDSKNETINSGESKYIDLFFVPDIGGDNKQIKIEIIGNS